MAQGDITKEIENDRIEVVLKWNVQVRQATKLMEEQADGSKVELNRSFHRSVLTPFQSVKGSDGNWTHTATDISGQDADVKAVCNAVWTNSVKAEYKTWREAQPTL
tara:strand:+ start:258 stop:575 length:318 start_codon:yes stop_codon:yes gene_type:complete